MSKYKIVWRWLVYIRHVLVRVPAAMRLILFDWIYKLEQLNPIHDGSRGSVVWQEFQLLNDKMNGSGIIENWDIGKLKGGLPQNSAYPN